MGVTETFFTDCALATAPANTRKNTTNNAMLRDVMRVSFCLSTDFKHTPEAGGERWEAVLRCSPAGCAVRVAMNKCNRVATQKSHKTGPEEAQQGVVPQHVERKHSR